MTLNSLFNARALTRTLLIAATGFMPMVANAGEVTMKSEDGTVNLVGEFVAFDQGDYVIRTALGELRISAARVRCEGESCPVFDEVQANVTFAGSDTVGLGLMPLLLSGYASHVDAEALTKNTGNAGETVVELVGDSGFGDAIGSYLVASSSTGSAFSALLEKTAELGMASRRILPQEARDLRAAGAGNMVSLSQEHIIAVDSLVVITHPENPVQSISIDQLADVYTGRITNWSELGGDDQAIRVIDRPSESGTRGVFASNVFADPADATQQVGETVDDNNTVASTVYNDPAAIGYVGFAFQRGAKALSLINECGIETTPDAFSAKTEEYPLQRRLYVYNRADNFSTETSDFVQYAKSNAADGVIAKSGFIDLGVSTQGMGLDSARALQLQDPNADAYEGTFMRQMLEEMTQQVRLSTTFRFRTGSSKLDERALVDMNRLVEYLKEQPEGTKVEFVGFTDSQGAFDSNRALSNDRASIASQAFRNLIGDELPNIEISTTGFGEIAPSACNTTNLGRSINRRVEVWMTQG